jgi:hypothetical protein
MSCGSQIETCEAQGFRCAAPLTTCGAEVVGCGTPFATCTPQALRCDTHGVSCGTQGSTRDTQGLTQETQGPAQETQSTTGGTLGERGGRHREEWPTLGKSRECRRGMRTCARVDRRAPRNGRCDSLGSQLPRRSCRVALPWFVGRRLRCPSSRLDGLWSAAREEHVRAGYVVCASLVVAPRSNAADAGCPSPRALQKRRG